MGGNEQKPIIRFRGFTDSWEQRKLCEVAQITMGQSPDGSTYSDTPSTYILVQGNADLKDGWVSPRIWTTQKTKTAEAGDLIMSVRAPAGAMGKTAYDVVLGRGVAGIKGNEFLYQTLVKMDGNGYWKKLAAGSTFESINSDAVSNAVIMVPQDEEQAKIGAFFDVLDRTITLHQREHDILVNVKKSMLERLFPREGSNVPEIRFAGFNNAWTQHKVTELGDIYIGLVTTMTSHYTDHGTLLIRNSDIKDGRFQFGSNPIYLDDDFAKQNTSRKHRVGDVITVHTGDIGTSAVITEKEAGSIGFATIVTRPDKGKITSEFLCTYLNTDAHKNFAMNISTGDGRNNYNLKDYYECIIPLPCIEEQKKISSFVSGLNRLINTHQHKLEKLQSIKASMLERMFV